MAQAGTLAHRAALLEREDELAALAGALTRARRGTGSLVIVAAQAGAGKSALIEAAVASAARRRLAALTARGSELEQELPFGVVRQLLEPPSGRFRRRLGDGC